MRKRNRKFWYVDMGQVVCWRQRVVCAAVGTYLMLLDIDTVVKYVFYWLIGSSSIKNWLLHGKRAFRRLRTWVAAVNIFHTWWAWRCECFLNFLAFDNVVYKGIEYILGCRDISSWGFKVAAAGGKGSLNVLHWRKSCVLTCGYFLL